MTPGQIVELVTAVGGTSWLVSLATVHASKRKLLAEAGRTDADAAEKIKKSALDLVAEMEKDAQEARVEVRALRADVRGLEQQLSEAIEVGKEAVAELRRLKAAILDPAATIGALRDLVTRSSRNGAP